MDIAPPKKKILLADDDQFIVVVYKDGFEQAGYDVVVARDGEETLKQMEAEQPDLVILDIIMPKLNGFEVIKTAKADPKLANIPILVLTNLSQPSDEQEARTSGANDFITKFNASFDDVVVHVQQLIGS